MKARLRRRLLIALLAVFAVNAAFGYGACCAGMDAAAETAEMPCHDGADEAPADHEKCCAACFGMVATAAPERAAPLAPEAPVALAMHTRFSGNPDPPYRPPARPLC